MNGRSPRRDLIGLFNWSDRPSNFDSALERIGLASGTDYVAFDFWANALVPALTNRLQTQLPARSCQMLAVRPRLDRPQLISTSRHVTQRQESDRIEILSGLFEGRTTGTSIGFIIRNEDQRSQAKYQLDPGVADEARRRMQQLLDRHPLYPELIV